MSLHHGVDEFLDHQHCLVRFSDGPVVTGYIRYHNTARNEIRWGETDKPNWSHGGGYLTSWDFECVEHKGAKPNLNKLAIGDKVRITGYPADQWNNYAAEVVAFGSKPSGEKLISVKMLEGPLEESTGAFTEKYITTDLGGLVLDEREQLVEFVQQIIRDAGRPVPSKSYTRDVLNALDTLIAKDDNG